MANQLRVLVEQPTRGKRWVAVAADWPGLERGGKAEDEALEKLARYVPRYLPVAKRTRLDSELEAQTDLEVIGRYPGTSSSATSSRTRAATSRSACRRSPSWRTC